ncbi:hypothetical protein AB1N83_008691 [Pleurotus pulmonarius]
MTATAPSLGGPLSSVAPSAHPRNFCGPLSRNDAFFPPSFTFTEMAVTIPQCGGPYLPSLPPPLHRRDPRSHPNQVGAPISRPSLCLSVVLIPEATPTRWGPLSHLHPILSSLLSPISIPLAWGPLSPNHPIVPPIAAMHEACPRCLSTVPPPSGNIRSDLLLCWCARIWLLHPSA